jgi:hypothetical protein
MAGRARPSEQQDGAWNDPVLDAVLGPLAARCYGRAVHILQSQTPVQVFLPDGVVAQAKP